MSCFHELVALKSISMSLFQWNRVNETVSGLTVVTIGFPGAGDRKLQSSLSKNFLTVSLGHRPISVTGQPRSQVSLGHRSASVTG